MTTDTQALIERLRASVVIQDLGSVTMVVDGVESLCNLGQITQVRNPDGSAAADEIDRLTTALTEAEAKLAKAREALEGVLPYVEAERLAEAIQKAVEDMPYRPSADDVDPVTLREFFEGTWQGQHADEVFSSAAKVASDAAIAATLAWVEREKK